MNPARRNALTLGVVAVAAGAAGAFAGALALQSRSGTAELLSQRFLDLSGRPRTLSEWRGRPLLCNFWATWCEPCREELPLLSAGKRKYAPFGIEVVGIAADNAVNVREYVNRLELDIIFLVGGAATVALMRRLGNGAGALPFSVLLDGSGRVRDRMLGAFTAASLERSLAALLR
jgi:thiol-disulfide isomerase/thioredoxin